MVLELDGKIKRNGKPNGIQEGLNGIWKSNPNGSLDSEWYLEEQSEWYTEH